MTPSLLSVSGLCRSFGAVRALNGVNLQIASGELVGVIGPNGSGKTTLFNCVTGRLSADAGEVIFDGARVTRSRMRHSARRGLLRTFQESTTFHSATTAENIGMALAMGRRYATDRESPWTTTKELLTLMRLGSAQDTPARVLSFGHQRKLGIGLCLAMRPRLMLLDEPAAGLNPAESAELADCLRTIRAAGIALAVVDHDMDFILPLVERVVVLAEGRVIVSDTPDRVRTHQQVLEVYLGHRPGPARRAEGPRS